MRRYLIATLSLASLAALPPVAQAVAQSSPQGPLQIAQAPKTAPQGGEEQPPNPGNNPQGRDAGAKKGGGGPPAGAAGAGQGKRAPRDNAGAKGPKAPAARQAQPQTAPKQNPREQRRERAGPGPERQKAPQATTPPAAKVQQAPPAVNQKQTAPKVEPRGEPRRGPERARDAGPARNVTPPPAAKAPTPPTPPVQIIQPGNERLKRDRGPGALPQGRPAQQVNPATPPTLPPGRPKTGSPPPPAQAGTPPGNPPRGEGRRFSGSIDDIKRGRRQRVEDGGKRTITEEPGNRVIVQEKGAPAMIRHDEGERLTRSARDVRRERRPDGGNLTIAIRPGGIEVFSEFDSSGRLMRRYRRDRGGREMNLIDNRRFRRDAPFILQLGPPMLRIPRDRYIMDYTRASDDDIYDALMDGPVDRLERGYSLDEIRYNGDLRDRMRRVDLDTVNFDFGSWQVPYDQYRRLERIANIINRILDRAPDEVFLIEGHTDAVGSDLDNLTLSDRRAEEVAVILTETFAVPPENLITQGYGEEFLKVPTLAAEIANRRVAVRRITPLLARGQ